MGWRHLAARHEQQRRRCSGRTSDRSHHVVGSWSCNFRGAGRRRTGFAAVSIVFEASQAVYAVLRTFGGRAAAAPVVLPLAMVASRLSIGRRHGTNSRGRLRLHRTSHVEVDKLPKLNFDFRLNSTYEVVFFIFLLNLIFRINSENACLVIHFFTNQMQIKFILKKKYRNLSWQVPR